MTLAQKIAAAIDEAATLENASIYKIKVDKFLFAESCLEQAPSFQDVKLEQFSLTYTPSRVERAVEALEDRFDKINKTTSLEHYKHNQERLRQ